MSKVYVYGFLIKIQTYFMRMANLIHENQYQFRPTFLRDGLWGKLNLDHYPENRLLWLVKPCLSGTKEHSYLLGRISAQLDKYFICIF